MGQSLPCRTRDAQAATKSRFQRATKVLWRIAWITIGCSPRRHRQGRGKVIMTTITEIITFTALNFTGNTTVPIPPVDPVMGVITVTYDPSQTFPQAKQSHNRLPQHQLHALLQHGKLSLVVRNRANAMLVMAAGRI
jgi:hypothetical protein